ncbi:MAG TPA: signal recognition particle-docking protein FtsY [Dehalococcoidia bacterium]|nr:signal recognition particle-docking protein FtsY [Dehalococcoidia bacterium]
MLFDLKKKTEQSLVRSRESWFSKVARLFDRNHIENETWDELEELLISADVGVETVEKLIKKVKSRVAAEKLSTGEEVRDALQEEMIALLNANGQQPIAQNKSIHVILVVGVNGSGKTTTIAKLANSLKRDDRKVILAAADTFRAAAIDQLKLWAERIGVDVIAHQPNADPGAVVFDAIQAAQSRNAQIVIIDTAGRLHTKFNLMEELKKIKRIATREDMSQEALLVIDATTGQNGLVQAKHFAESAGITGIVLTKLDGTAKGGIVLAIRDQLSLPIVYIGTGEGVDDIVPFDSKTFVEAIFAS